MPGHERTVVVVEDDPNIADLLDLYLREAGFRVLLAATGERGLSWSTSTARARRARHRPARHRRLRGVPAHPRDAARLPVLFLTARDGEIDRVLGLELGADDYVTKPFSPREVVARVKAILRRGQTPPPRRRPRSSTIGDERRGRPRPPRGRAPTASRSPLATREFDLLAFLAAQPGHRPVSRQQLLDGVWGADWYGDERTVDVHVRQLRKKLGDDLPLATVWGIGYRLG